MSFQYLFKLVFSNKDKIIIKNDYEEKWWSAYKIWKEHSSKNWNYIFVKRLLKRFKDSSTMNKKEGSGQSMSVTTEENNNLIEELICSQEEASHSHLAPRTISEQVGISCSSIRRMAKKRNFPQLERVKTPEMNDGCRNRRYAHVIALAEKLERNARMIENTVWQDEKEFALDVPINLQNDGVYGKEKNLMFQMRTCLRPRIRCQEKLWFLLQSLGTEPRNRFL